MRKPTREENKTIRAITKKHKIAGCRSALRRTLVGKQCQLVKPEVARAFAADLSAAGFEIEPLFLEGPMIDTFLIYAN